MIIEIIGAAFALFLFGWGVLVISAELSKMIDEWGK